MGRKIEMTWTCSACGTENLGRHKVCPSCGDPKDASEKFVMPGSTRAAPTVTDPELLGKAHAGADWRCERCGSNQSRLVTACTQCGAVRPEGAGNAERSEAPAAVPQPVSWNAGPMWIATAILGVLLLAAGAVTVPTVLLVGAASHGPSMPPPPVDVAARVVSHHWQRSLVVERYAIRPQEGFEESRPADAMDVKKAGRRHHHDEQVLDHMGTENYTVEVPDGYDTVYDSVQVACGEDCTTEAQSCHEDCTSDDNGFADCHEVCSGGGQSCTTRYCTEQQARQVPRTRTETRQRDVPVYRTEPRDAEWYTWNEWTWATDRRFDREEDGTPAVWPSDDEVKLSVGLGKGEQERAQRSESYSVTFAASDRLRWLQPVPDEASWLAFADGSFHLVRLSSDLGMVLAIDPAPVAVGEAAR